MWCHLLLILPVAGLGLFAVLPLSIALPAYLVVSAVSLLVYRSTFQAMHRPVTTGREGMIGARAEVVQRLASGHPTPASEEIVEGLTDREMDVLRLAESRGPVSSRGQGTRIADRAAGHPGRL